MKHIAAYTILVILLLCSIWYGYDQRKEKLRWKNNFETSEIDHARELELTKEELKDYYGDSIKELRRQLGIKPKQVDRIIKVRYDVHDTALIHLFTRDSVFIITDTTKFLIEKSCFTLTGYLFKKDMFVDINWRDRGTLVLYWKRPKKFLFIEYGKKQYRAKFYSECSKSEQEITKNIRIQKE